MKTDSVVVECATVTFFRGNKEEPERSFGFAETDDKESIHIGILGCRKVVAGAEEPEFGAQWNQWPRVGDKIRFIRNRRQPIGKAWPAWQWGFEFFWQKAWDEIEQRPYYRVIVNSRQFKGQFEKIAINTKVTAEGTLELLQSQHPRLPDGQNDRLGSVYRSDPVTEWQSWQRYARTEGDKDIFEPCADPRPLPVEAKPVTKPTSALSAGSDDGRNGKEFANILAQDAPHPTTQEWSPGTSETATATGVANDETELLALANSTSGRRTGTATKRSWLPRNPR